MFCTPKPNNLQQSQVCYDVKKSYENQNLYVNQLNLSIQTCKPIKNNHTNL